MFEEEFYQEILRQGLLIISVVLLFTGERLRGLLMIKFLEFKCYHLRMPVRLLQIIINPIFV